jgi:potassium-dependent mechanosensitive channel
MENNSLEVIIDQLEILLIFIQRPIVQIQLLTLLGVLVVAFLISRQLRRVIERFVRGMLRNSSPEVKKRVMEGVLPATNEERYLILVLLLGYAAAYNLDENGQPAGLLFNVLLLFWFVLAYEIFVSLLYAIFRTDVVRLYHRRIFNPLFFLSIAGLIASRLFDLDRLGDIQLLRLFDTDITLGTMVISILVLYAFFVISGIVRDFIEIIVQPRLDADRGTIHAMTTISGYVMISLGIISSLTTLGFNFTTLAVIGGGLSVGIGFGLQQIVANFISGIVLLFEQSLRPGDIVEVDERICTVEKLSIRSTTVRTLNNVEVIIPNETFLTNAVTTYTGTNRQIRLLLPVGVSYDSDPKYIRQLLLETAAKHGLVLKKPAPMVLFNGFGASSIDFSLGVWIEKPAKMFAVRSDLYFMIWETLEKYDIEIPFPQNDLNLRRGWRDIFSEQAEATHDDNHREKIEQEAPSERPKLP